MFSPIRDVLEDPILDDSDENESDGEEATILSKTIREVRADPQSAVKYSRKPPTVDLPGKLKVKYPFEKDPAKEADENRV